MVKALKNTLLVGATTLACSAAQSEPVTWGINVTFCSDQWPKAPCGSAGTEPMATEEDAAVQECPVDPQADDEDKAKSPHAVAPYTAFSHKLASTDSSMVTASGSCFIWSHFLDSEFWAFRKLDSFALSARAWCGGSGDKPTVQFYNSGNCDEETNLGDKALLFDSPDQCGLYNLNNEEEDGPFVRLGAFSCVPTNSSFNVIESCASTTFKDAEGQLQGKESIPAAYTIATDV